VNADVVEVVVEESLVFSVWDAELKGVKESIIEDVVSTMEAEATSFRVVSILVVESSTSPVMVPVGVRIVPVVAEILETLLVCFDFIFVPVV